MLKRVVVYGVKTHSHTFIANIAARAAGKDQTAGAKGVWSSVGPAVLEAAFILPMIVAHDAVLRVAAPGSKAKPVPELMANASCDARPDSDH